jgi:hypothetical protein
MELKYVRQSSRRLHHNSFKSTSCTQEDNCGKLGKCVIVNGGLLWVLENRVRSEVNGFWKLGVTNCIHHRTLLLEYM